MGWRTIIGAATLAGLVVALAMPAEAAKKKHRVSTIYYGSPDRVVYGRRAPTRITVQRRSFLDAGTETKQYEEHYTDYAFPPGYTSSPDRTNPNFGYERMPFPGPWDLPGYRP